MTRKQGGCCLEKEIMQGTMRGARRRGRPRTAWMDNIKTWTGLTMEESIRMAEDRDNGESTFMVWPTLGSRMDEEQNRTTLRTSQLTWATSSPVDLYLPHPESPFIIIVSQLRSWCWGLWWWQVPWRASNVWCSSCRVDDREVSTDEQRQRVRHVVTPLSLIHISEPTRPY